MTSSGICPCCQGQVTLYENQFEEFGRVWYQFSGKCPNCGHFCSEWPDGQYDAYADAEQEAQKTAELDRRLKRCEGKTFFEFLREGYWEPSDWVWWHAYDADGNLLGSAAYDDEIDAIACAKLPVGASYTIKRADRPVRDGIVTEDSKKYRLHVDFAISRFYGDEDGTYYDFDYCLPVKGLAERIIKRYQGCMYFRHKLEVME